MIGNALDILNVEECISSSAHIRSHIVLNEGLGIPGLFFFITRMLVPVEELEKKILEDFLKRNPGGLVSRLYQEFPQLEKNAALFKIIFFWRNGCSLVLALAFTFTIGAFVYCWPLMTGGFYLDE